MKTIERAHCELEHDWSNGSPKLRFADGGRYLKISFARSPAREWNDEQFYNREKRGLRGKCKGFSFGSRRRMMDRINTISAGAELPQFVGLNFPDTEYDECVTRFAAKAKNNLSIIIKRLVRVCPFASGFWRIEWKPRLSGAHVGKYFPHFHLIVYGISSRLVPSLVVDHPDEIEAFVNLPDNQARFDFVKTFAETAKPIEAGAESTQDGAPGRGLAGEYGLVGENKTAPQPSPSSHEFDWNLAGENIHFSCRTQKLMSFIVCRHLINFDSPDRQNIMSFQDWFSLNWYQVVGSNYSPAFSAGARCSRAKSWGGVAHYSSKYICKVDEQDFYSQNFLGRQWGVFNRLHVPWAKMVELDLEEEVGVRLRRIARRYLQHCSGRRRHFPYGVTLYCDVANLRRFWERPPPDPF
jgi:hypothetical protein